MLNYLGAVIPLGAVKRMWAKLNLEGAFRKFSP